MGYLAGHVSTGLAFLFVGVWHLFNHIKLHTLSPNTYTSHIWFPFPTLRYLEPLIIALGSASFIGWWLFVGPKPIHDDHHQTLHITTHAPPTNNLHFHEHTTISFALLVYASFAIIFDRIRIKNPSMLPGLLQSIAAVALFQMFLLFHFHSTDHMGVEGQFHWLLQIAILLSFVTGVLGIWRPRSFLLSFVRSAAIAFQGVWLVVMGFALWTPSLVPEGCFMKLEDGRFIVRCKDEMALNRAKALINLEFSWAVSGMVVFCVVLYLVVAKLYENKQEYSALSEEEEDLEAQKMKAGEAAVIGFVVNGEKIVKA